MKDNRLEDSVSLGDGTQRRLLPEPAAKRILSQHGIAIPRGVVVGASAIGSIAEACGQLSGRLALKAFGPGIVHKTDIGAVALNADPAALRGLAEKMCARLREQGLVPTGFLVEEMQPPGIELIVGAVVLSSGIPVVTLGLGGIFSEALDAVATRIYPLERSDALALIEEFPGARLLAGSRRTPAADREALVAAILAIAGAKGVVEAFLREGLSEFEVNPLIASTAGAVAADARIVLQPPPLREEPECFDFDLLFKPRSIAVAGASRKGGRGVANRSLAFYKELGWKDHLYAIHPSEKEIDGVPAYRSPRDVPGGRIDYLKVAVPPAAVPELIRQSSGCVGVAQVVTGGFSELNAEGRALEEQILGAARAGGVRVVGPNCLGTYCPAGRQSFRGGARSIAGSVGLIAQSGGLAGDFINLGEAEGLGFSKVVSVGNSIDMTLAEVLEELVRDSDTSVIGLYIEGLRDGVRFVQALRAARGKKPVVALIGGTTEAGGIAAISHTGRLTSDARTWSAIGKSTGLFCVDTLEDLLGALQMHHRYPDADMEAEALLIMGSGGGATTLAGDAAGRAGVSLPQFEKPALERLASVPTGIPKALVNPLELVIISPESVTRSAQAVLEQLRGVQFFSDVLIHANMATYYAYADRQPNVEPLLELIKGLGELAGAPWRIAFVLKNSRLVPPAHLDVLRCQCRETGLPLFPTVEGALVAIAAAQHSSRLRRKAGAARRRA